MLGMRMLDLYWKIGPAQPGHEPRGYGAVAFSIGWTDLAAPIGIGGIWLAVFLGQLQQRPLLPRFDPHLAEATHHE